MTEPPPAPPVTVVVAVPDRSTPHEVLTAAITTHHPDWTTTLVWAGDPQLRPAPGPRWTAGVHTELELARVEPDARALLAALGVVPSVPSEHAVVVLAAGRVAVLDALDGLLAPPGQLLVVPRLLAPPGVEDRSPSLADIAEAGSVTASVVAFGPGERPAARWLRAQLLTSDPIAAGPSLDLAAQLFPSQRCPDPRIGVSAWRWDVDHPALVDAPRYDPARPWLLDTGLDGLPRVSLSVGARRSVMDAAANQLGPTAPPLRLPGALEVDEVVRAVIRSHPESVLEPWSDAAAFRRFLDRHYWTALLDLHPDVRGAFATAFGVDTERFAAWARRAASEGRAPFLVDPASASVGSAVARTDDRTDGVNLIGYFRHQSGVANVGRRLAAILDRHGIPYTTVAYERTESPLLDPVPECDQRLEFATSLVFANGDQFAMFRHDLPQVYGPGRKVIGLWSWELETLDGAAPLGDEHVDEIWATTTFMARSFETLGSVPVQVVPIPFTEPEASDRRPEDFAPLRGTEGRFVFGVVLDHLSITARKNPIGAVRAFRRAFEPDEGPLLVVKTINARRCWQEHERLLAAAAGRDDVVVWDEHLSRGDHLAFIRSLDALVSLHRSEGVGLHLTEAMWMGVPTIATRYSGNLDFMDDDSAVLIDADLVPVGVDGGWAYPATARWADPDLDQAAAAMRRLVADPEYARRIGAGARERMLAQADEAVFVARLRQLLGW